MIRVSVLVLMALLIAKEAKSLIKRKDIRYQDLWIKNKGLMINYILALGLFMALGKAFKLQWSYLGILCFASLFVLYHMLRQLRRFHHEYDEVTQLILVMTHLSHQFKSHQKIEHALMEVFDVCTKSTQDKLQVVVDNLHTGSYQDAFNTYHRHYLLKTLVTTMAHAQEQGDDNIFHALNLIEQDIDELNNQVFVFIQQMNTLRNKVLMLCVFGLGVSYVSQNMLTMVVDLSGMGLYQDIVFLFMLGNLILLGFSFNIMGVSLLMKEEMLL